MTRQEWLVQQVANSPPATQAQEAVVRTIRRVARKQLAA
jgi:hypothetical protein